MATAFPESTTGSSDTEAQQILQRARELEARQSQDLPVSTQLSTLDVKDSEVDVIAADSSSLTKDRVNEYPMWKLPSGKCLYDLHPTIPGPDLVINEVSEPSIVLDPTNASHAPIVSEACTSANIDIQPLHVAIKTGRVCVERKKPAGHFEVLKRPKLTPVVMDPKRMSDYQSLLVFSPPARGKHVTFEGDPLPPGRKPPDVIFDEKTAQEVSNWINVQEGETGEEYLNVVQNWILDLEKLKKTEDPAGLVQISMVDLSRLTANQMHQIQVFAEAIYQFLDNARKEINNALFDLPLDQSTPLANRALQELEEYEKKYTELTAIITLRQAIEKLALQETTTSTLLEHQSQRQPSHDATERLRKLQDQQDLRNLRTTVDQAKAEYQKIQDKATQPPTTPVQKTLVKVSAAPRKPVLKKPSLSPIPKDTLPKTPYPSPPEEMAPSIPIGQQFEGAEYEAAHQFKRKAYSQAGPGTSPSILTSTPLDVDLELSDMELTETQQGLEVEKQLFAERIRLQTEQFSRTIQQKDEEIYRKQLEAEAAKKALQDKMSEMISLQDEKDSKLRDLRYQLEEQVKALTTTRVQNQRLTSQVQQGKQDAQRLLEKASQQRNIILSLKENRALVEQQDSEKTLRIAQLEESQLQAEKRMTVMKQQLEALMSKSTPEETRGEFSSPLISSPDTPSKWTQYHTREKSGGQTQSSSTTKIQRERNHLFPHRGPKDLLERNNTRRNKPLVPAMTRTNHHAPETLDRFPRNPPSHLGT